MKVIKNIFIMLAIILILFVTLKLDYNLSKNKNSLISMYEKRGTQLNLIRKIPDGNLELIYTCKENESLTWDNIKRQIRFSSNSEATRCNLTFQKSDVTLVLSPANGNVLLDQEVTSEITGSNYGVLSCTVSNPLLATCSIKENILTVTGKNIGSTTVEVKESNLNKTVTYTVNVITSLYNKILKDNTAQSDASLNFAQPSSDTNGKGLYYTSDLQYGEDNILIYYYRGEVDNNWVSFGGYLWRIVRTTSEGGVKLVYSGDGVEESSAFINLSSTFDSESNRYYSTYIVGYTYNSNGFTNTPQTDSTIKTVVDSWYNTNLKSNENYLSSTAIYCNDKSSGVTYPTYYPAYDRVVTNSRPTYACLGAYGSRYTVDSSVGNGYLTNSIALLTTDEVHYAGLVWYERIESLNSYIMENTTARRWYLMSPAYYMRMFIVASAGALYHNNTYSTSGVRPAVSLKSCITTINGNGTKSNPYIISNSSC